MNAQESEIINQNHIKSEEHEKNKTKYCRRRAEELAAGESQP
jgi:hypothetical protein